MKADVKGKKEPIGRTSVKGKWPFGEREGSLFRSEKGPEECSSKGKVGWSIKQKEKKKAVSGGASPPAEGSSNNKKKARARL